MDQIHLDWSDHNVYINGVFTSKQIYDDLKFIREALHRITSIASREKLLHIPEVFNKDDETYWKTKDMDTLPKC